MLELIEFTKLYENPLIFATYIRSQRLKRIPRYILPTHLQIFLWEMSEGYISSSILARKKWYICVGNTKSGVTAKSFFGLDRKYNLRMQLHTKSKLCPRYGC